MPSSNAISRAFDSRGSPSARRVLLVEDVDRKTIHALQYAKTIRSTRPRGGPRRRRPDGRSRICETAVAPSCERRPARGPPRQRRPAASRRRLRDGLPGRPDVERARPRPRADGPTRAAPPRPDRSAAHAQPLPPNPHVRVTLVRDHPQAHGDDEPSVRAAPAANGHTEPSSWSTDPIAPPSAPSGTRSRSVPTEVVAVHAAVDPDAPGRAHRRGGWICACPSPLDARSSAGTATWRGRSSATSSTSWTQGPRSPSCSLAGTSPG